MEKYLRDDRLEGQKQNSDSAETYFIIHPVLKHLALFGMEQLQKEKRLGS